MHYAAYAGPEEAPAFLEAVINDKGRVEFDVEATQGNISISHPAVPRLDMPTEDQLQTFAIIASQDEVDETTMPVMPKETCRSCRRELADGTIVCKCGTWTKQLKHMHDREQETHTLS